VNPRPVGAVRSTGSFMNDKRILFVLCPNHSGSTLMEYYLSSYPKSIGIGEAYNAVSCFRKRQLKGLSDYDRETIKRIPFWQYVLSLTDENAKLEDQYLRMYEHIYSSNFFSGYDTIIDSSKSMGALRILLEHYGDQVQVIVIYKDVRSWIISQFDNSRRKKRKIPFAYNMKLFLKWYRTYCKIERNLEIASKAFTRLSYDLFCLNRKTVEQKLQMELRLDGEPDFSNTNSINILGNRMKIESNRELVISYDYRWMHRGEWVLPWFILPSKFRQFNQKRVWEN
jgi:hypothetical protein